MDLKELVMGLSSTPFLFVGSGLSRRYLGLPDWQQLLRVFSQRISADEFAFQSYLNRARVELASDQQELALVAQLIERDFNKKWYDDPAFRTLDIEHLQFIKTGQSPFKVELAQYLKKISTWNPSMQDEINILRQLAKNSLSGIITTNYDDMLEQVAEGYTVYTGQEELLFSPLQSLAEIYKIHGSMSMPASIIITQDDYQEFEQKSAYLAAKLMTIFMEYPIIFIGYSLSDPNIKTIMQAIVRGLAEEHLEKLQNRLIHIEWAPGQRNVDVSPSSIVIDGSTIRMTSIRTDNFAAVFQALSEKRTAIPVKMLRMFKQEFYSYTLTGVPTGRMRIAGIDDERVSDEDLVLAIANPERLGLRGLSGLKAEEWYRNIVLSDLNFSADELLQHAYPQLIRNNVLLPLHKLLSEAQEEYPEIEKKALRGFDATLNGTIRKNRKGRAIRIRTVNGIIRDYPTKKAIADIAHLLEHEIDLNELEAFLTECFRDEDFYKKSDPAVGSDFRRLVRIYDWLKYGKHRKERNS